VLPVVLIEFNHFYGWETFVKILKDMLRIVSAPVVDVYDLIGLANVVKGITKSLLKPMVLEKTRL